MRGLFLALLLLPSVAKADVLICYFTPTTCPPETSCEPFTLTINSHHGADAPYIDYGGVSASVTIVPEERVDAPSYVTLGHGDREVITLFSGRNALHTRHYLSGDVPSVQSSTGSCYSFN